MHHAEIVAVKGEEVMMSHFSVVLLCGKHWVFYWALSHLGSGEVCQGGQC